MARFPESFNGGDDKQSSETTRTKKKSRRFAGVTGATVETADKPKPAVSKDRSSESLTSILRSTREDQSSTDPAKTEKTDIGSDTTMRESRVQTSSETADSPRPSRAVREAREADDASGSGSTEMRSDEVKKDGEDVSGIPQALETSDQAAISETTHHAEMFRPNQLNGGEVVIDLSQDAPSAEHVVPLHGSDTYGERVEYPVFSRQPERHDGKEDPWPQPIQSAPVQEVQSMRPEISQSTMVREYDQPFVQTETVVSASGTRSDMEIIAPYEAEFNPTSTATRPNEEQASKRELDEAFARSAKVHGRRGALSGLLIGTLFANRGLRRKQKQEAKRLNSQDERITQLERQMTPRATEQGRQQNTTERRSALTEARLDTQPAKEESEQGIAHRKNRRLNDEGLRKRMELPSDRHLETSTWHAIEVDNKTGKAVETPTFAYGHEYYREKAAENGPKDKRNALAGEVAIIAATGAKVTTSKASQKSSKDDDGSDKRRKPDTRQKAKAAIGAALKAVQGTSPQAGPIWPWAIALVAIVIVLALLIR